MHEIAAVLAIAMKENHGLALTLFYEVELYIHSLLVVFDLEVPLGEWSILCFCKLRRQTKPTNRECYKPPLKYKMQHSIPAGNPYINFFLSSSENFSIAYRNMVRGIVVYRVESQPFNRCSSRLPASRSSQPTAF